MGPACGRQARNGGQAPGNSNAWVEVVWKGAPLSELGSSTSWLVT